MSSSNELDIYKQTNIKNLTNQYNAMIILLRNKLVADINRINALNISRIFKNNQINIIIKKYNETVSKITLEYIKIKNTINSLTSMHNNNNNNNNKKEALLIGINYIGKSYELKGCINDTTNLKNLLQQSFSYNNFTLLTDLTNKKPNKTNIMDELTKLLVNSKEGDHIFFLYSGHGTHTADLNRDELDGQDEMIFPLEAFNNKTCISDDELFNVIKTNLKLGVKLFMLFDSCFSGTVVDLKYNYLVNNLETINNPNVSETKGQVIMISGCKDNQTSADTYVNFNGKNDFSGAMTFAFLETINTLGIKITYKTLLENMRSILLKNNYSQIPQCSSGTLMDINNLYINF